MQSQSLRTYKGIHKEEKTHMQSQSLRKRETWFKRLEFFSLHLLN